MVVFSRLIQVKVQKKNIFCINSTHHLWGNTAQAAGTINVKLKQNKHVHYIIPLPINNPIKIVCIKVFTIKIYN